MALRLNYFFCLLAVLVPAFCNAQTKIDIAGKGIYDNSFCRNTFYTWTTEEQISHLRATKTLLTKSKSETKGSSIFDLSLRDSALKNNASVQLLLEKQFSKKRFAWVNSWATIMGWEGESYGNQLIKIVLKDSAIIGKFNRADTIEPVGFYDMNGQKLSLEVVLKYKHRIAAVYHENTNKKNRFIMTGDGTYSKRKKISVEEYIPYREYVIINENMIRQWSYGTPEIKEEIKSEISLLSEFQKSKYATKNGYDSWNKGWQGTDVENVPDYNIEKYHLLSCFENNYYLFHSKKIKAIIKNLQAALKQQTAEISK